MKKQFPLLYFFILFLFASLASYSATRSSLQCSWYPVQPFAGQLHRPGLRPTGKVQSYAVLSSLDSRKYKSGRTLKEVIIPYKLTYSLETSLYKVYHDEEIDTTLLKGFGLYELLILKNMIFAKHNYAFDKPFYQAYFNLFGFYNDEKKRASPTKDMTGLLLMTYFGMFCCFWT